MGTGALTIITGRDGEYLRMYRQSDGYPSWHGRELFEAFGDFTLSHGLTGRKNTANGMGCFAAQVVAKFKDGEGGIYLLPCGTRAYDIEYHYHIKYSPDDELYIQLSYPTDEEHENILYWGRLAEFGEWLEENKD